jgi:DNA-binding GntR family transcriptional regulator
MAEPGALPMLRRATLGDDVYEALKTLVLDHRLAPGDRVNIDALARDLAVSPTPVREALARLESDGLVRKRPLAGYTVSPLLTRQEFTDMFDKRLVLEGAAARWAAQRADRPTRAAIDEAADVVAVSGPGTDGRQSEAAFTAADARFHGLIAVATGNPLLRDAIGRLHVHLHLHRLYFPATQTGTTAAEHRAVAVAITAGDPDAAQAAMHAHLSAARQRHLPAFD